MAVLKSISLPHGTIPTQMFGNVNLQNAIMYVNENFAEVKSGVNEAISATNDALKEKAASDHDHNDAYAALEHTHGMDAVTGLNAALDDKAALNHEHSQYLSSLPAHCHDVSGIQGLGEQLQAKAEKVHSHTTAQIEGLDTKLGVLASTSYVDQQVNSVGSSIKTIADQEIIDYGAAKEGASGSASADVPKNTEIAPANETAAQKNARVGTANRWARADHKHVFETETSDLTKLKHDGNGTDGAASFGTETKVPRIDHSHPLNFPDGRSTDDIAKDGAGQGGTASFGATNSYADLGHSHPLNVTEDNPADVVKSDGAASPGNATTYARSNHVHKMPSLSATDITYDSTTVGATLTNHEGRIDTLERGGGGGTVKKVDGKDPDTNGNVQLNALTTTNYSTTLDGVYQAKSDKLTALNAELSEDGEVPADMVYQDGCSTNCLAKFTSGVLSHTHNGLDNAATFGGDWPTLQKISQCFTIIGSGASAVLKILISKITGSSSDTNKVVTTNASGELALNDAGNGLKVDSGVLSVKAGTNITVDSNGISVANVSSTGFVKATNGTLGIPQEQPLTLPSGTGIVKSNGSALSASALTANEIPDLSSLYAPSSTEVVANSALAAANGAVTTANSAVTQAAGAVVTASNAVAAVEELGGTVATNTADIATNATNISTNTTNIATNAANIATNTANISANADNIATNTSSIATLNSDLSDLSDDLSTVKTWKAEGRTITFNIVTGVTWTGSALQMTRKSVTFTNGLLTVADNDSTVTIDTAVLFEQS